MSDFRPNHYIEGEDTFAWAERKNIPDVNILIAEFNIHKYLDRDKGSDYADFGKIIDYANWARKLMKDKNERTK